MTNEDIREQWTFFYGTVFYSSPMYQFPLRSQGNPLELNLK